jgi:hypothetical protein
VSMERRREINFGKHLIDGEEALWRRKTTTNEQCEVRYIMTGTLDKGPDALPPKGEFFTSQRNKFMPQIPSTYL